MGTNPIAPIVVTFLHDLFTAAWIGGMLTLAWAILPAARSTLGPGPDAKALMAKFRGRMSIVAYVSMAGLWITGLLLSRRGGSLFAFDTPYATVLSIKHILTVAMVAIALLRNLGGRIKVQLAGPRPQAALLVVNVILGVAVLALSGATAVLAKLPPAA